MRLGWVEKFILRYLWYYRRCVSDHDPANHGYRSQIVFVLFNLRHRNYRFSYRRNMRAVIPRKEYSHLQVLVTRSTKSLESKGLIRRDVLRRDYFKWRRYVFHLTEAGLQKARGLVRSTPVENVRDLLSKT